jgi:hypothetical protein
MREGLWEGLDRSIKRGIREGLMATMAAKVRDYIEHFGLIVEDQDTRHRRK